MVTGPGIVAVNSPVWGLGLAMAANDEIVNLRFRAGDGVAKLVVDSRSFAELI